ncbi:MAG: sulfotransferase family protein [Bacteroidia bacterium]|nr:sulfotransferase family protein [Bacteroidia bacterium]NNF31515.1 sulfotransferase family 2 domain-containing protein [Flavobacteriaceae bacterium]MBT8275590.1 sulfotransferase family protein [Bacteroidia bacterium]NNJ82780.1 sulfotransferase family 2 domain-containing protein [Flavobacteriaceae bacterium]NNK54094.1 sulfotransferase family 2 domain-containing protein [Flavobacteriaceae bacterium]
MHIPKVAGQSIETIFLQDLGLSWDERHELLLRKKKNNEAGPYRLAHLKAKEYLEYNYIDKETFDSYFKFSFVRNPYKRLLSVYNYLGYSRIISFTDFVGKVVKKALERDDFFYSPQYEYLYDEGKLMMDFVGKLENIKVDMKQVLIKTRLAGKEIPHVNKSEKGLKRGLAALIKTPRLWTRIKFRSLFSTRRKLNLNEEERALVYELYQKDFEYFNYEP